MKPRIIGLIGPEGAGKSTAAALLEGQNGYKRVPFAGPLKSMIAALGVDPRHLYGSLEDKAAPLGIFGGKSARHAMQTLGTEWGRNHIGQGFWVAAWMEAVKGIAYVAADDVRFPNEADAIRAMGGMIVCVVRSQDQFNRAPRHASENFAAINPDNIIVNDGSIDDLAAKLDMLADGDGDLIAFARRGRSRAVAAE